jgi:c(7)-type cytochrome triheme protein
MNRTVIWLFLAALLFSSISSADTFGVRKRAKRPHEFGNVVMNNNSERNNIAPVIFNHWLHRAEYTCRLCHVDLGFGMEANSTGSTEEDLNNGMYCGACHNGVEAFGSVEKDDLGNESKNCYKCHSYGKKVKFEQNFYQYVKGFPRMRYGNKVDWLKAEESGLVKLKDYLEGYSIKTKALKQTKDIDIKSKEMGIQDIIFSHNKHTVWNGCELCHPEIFGIKKGATVYSMQDIFEGKFCGACHGSVAFPNDDCQLCHTKDVY